MIFAFLQAYLVVGTILVGWLLLVAAREAA
jgi:hypothetical protein